MAMVAALLGAGGYTRDASAVPVLSLVYQGGGTSVDLLPGQSAVFDVMLTSDVDLITATWSVGVVGDLFITAATAGPNPVGFATVAMGIAPGGVCSGTPSNNCTALAGLTAGSFGGLTFGVLAPGTYDMGNVTVMANGAAGSSAEIRPFLGPLDEWFDGNFVQIPNSAIQAAAQSATVNVIPEPTTASLLGLGLAGLVFLGRRIRS
jgi:hypothetical protein